MGKKINPRRRPATMADVEKARQEAVHTAVNSALAIFFTIMCDKEGADEETLKRIWREVNDLSDSITQGYVSISDLKDTLKREYDIWL